MCRGRSGSLVGLVWSCVVFTPAKRRRRRRNCNLATIAYFPCCTQQSMYNKPLMYITKGDGGCLGAQRSIIPRTLSQARRTNTHSQAVCRSHQSSTSSPHPEGTSVQATVAHLQSSHCPPPRPSSPLLPPPSGEWSLSLVLPGARKRSCSFSGQDRMRGGGQGGRWGRDMRRYRQN